MLRSKDAEKGPSRVTWLERVAVDPTLAAFVQAEIGRAGVEASAWRAEAEHWRRVARLLRRELDKTRSADPRASVGTHSPAPPMLWDFESEDES